MLQTECAQLAGGPMNFWYKVFYMATTHIPRPLPSTPEEYNKLKNILRDYYGLDDTDDVWACVGGQITATPATKVWKSYSSIVNPVKRLKINKVAHEDRLAAYQRIQEKQMSDLKTAVDKVVEATDESRDLPKGSLNTEEPVFRVPEAPKILEEKA